VTSRLPPEVATRLVTLIVAGGDGEDDEGRAGIGGGPSVLALIKTDPGNVSLESMLTEIDKLLAVRAVGVPAEVFADVAPRVLAGWRAQAAVESPSHLRAHPNQATAVDGARPVGRPSLGGEHCRGPDSVLHVPFGR